MQGEEFFECLKAIVGSDNASRYAGRFGPLDGDANVHGLKNFELIAFFAYSTGMLWHQYINEQLWSAGPDKNVLVFRDVLNRALFKFPAYKGNGGTVYRGYKVDDLDGFLKNYVAGAVVRFPGFTSASFKEELAFGGNVLFIIRALTARVIWYVCATYDEYEVLIPAGRNFEVVEVVKDAWRTVVLLEELK